MSLEESVEPRNVTRMREELIALIDADDSQTVSIRKLAKWEGMDYETLLALNMSERYPPGVAYKNGDKGYHAINKLRLWNYCNSIMKG